MSLRRALAAWPDDRESVAAARAVIAFLERNQDQSFDLRRIERATGLADDVVASLLTALVAAVVVDCDGDPRDSECTYSPDGILQIEVRRFLKSATGVETGTRERIDRFRNRYGSGR